MPTQRRSLLAGRNANPLDDHAVRRVTNTFLGLDDKVSARYDPSRSTAFCKEVDENGHEYGEIVFGPDILPGRSVLDPNSALSLSAAAAHELTHYYRWRDGQELPAGDFDELDEALTSLQAISRYEKHLPEHDIRLLVADAVQRIQLHLQKLGM